MLRAFCFSAVIYDPGATPGVLPPVAVTEYDSEIGYRYISGIRVPVPHERGQYTVVTNSAGHRNSIDYSPERPSGAGRLLLIGDSLTAGDGVDNRERFSDRLEAKWPGLEAINCALPGTGTDQQLLLLKRYEARYEYDVLVICPLVENIRRNIAHYRLAVDRASGEVLAVPKPYYTMTDDGLELHHVPVPRPAKPLHSLPESELPYVDFGGHRASSQIRTLINRYAGPVKSWLIKLLQYQPHPEYDDPWSPEWQLMLAILREMVTQNAGKRTVIVPLPYYIHIEYPAAANYMPRFRELAGGDVSVIDVLPYFWRLSAVDRRRCRYRRDPHYTPFAHQVVAEALLDGLAELEPLRALNGRSGAARSGAVAVAR